MFKILAAILLLSAACEAANTFQITTTVKDCNAQRCLPPQTFYGSGFLIGQLNDGRYAVLTAAHVTKNQRWVEVGWWGGNVPGEVIATEISQDFDVSLIAVAADADPAQVECGSLVDGPEDGDVQLTGYDPATEGFVRCVGRMKYKSNRVYRVNTTGGCSGGAWKNGNDIYGVHWGRYQDDNIGAFTRSDRIREWLKIKIGYVPVCSQPNRQPVVTRPPPQVPPVAPPPPQAPQYPAVCNCKCNGNCGKDSEIIEKVKLLRIPVVVTVKKTDCNKETRIYRVYLVPKISGDNVVIVAEVYDTKNTEDTSDDVLLNDKAYDVLGGKEVRLTIVADDAGGK